MSDLIERGLIHLESTDAFPFPRMSTYPPTSPQFEGDLPTSPGTGGNATPSTQLPLSNISRLMKSSIPSESTLKLSSSTKHLMQAIVTEFITFITCEAQERADNSRRSTLNGDDILYALRVLGFEQYEAVGKIWLARYRIAQETNNAKTKRKG